MMWDYYRPRIITQRLMPFILYLITMNFTVIWGQEFITDIQTRVEGAELSKKLAKSTLYMILLALCGAM